MTFTLGTTQSLDNLTGFTGTSTGVQSFDIGGGRVLSTWTDPKTFVGTFAIHDITGSQLVAPQSYDAAGVVDPGFLGTAQTVFAVTLGPGDGFTIHYGANPTFGFPPSSNHVAVPIDASGTPGTAVPVTGYTAGLSDRNSVSLSLSNGNAAIATDAGLTVIDSAGKIVGGTTDGPGFTSSDNAFGLSETSTGGIFMASGKTSDPFGTGIDINGQFFDGNGVALGDTFDIAGPIDAPATANYINGRLNVDTLSDGRYVVVYGERDSELEAGDNSSAIHVIILKSDGSVDKGPFLGNPDASGARQFFPTVHALEDGAFVVGYATDDVTADNVSPLWRFQLFDSTGTADGASFFRGPDISAGTTGQTETIILSDGRGLIIDETGGSTGVTIGSTIVTPGNEAPETSGFSGTVTAGDVLSDTVTATDADGDTLIFSNGSTSATKGIATVNPDGSFSYTPNSGASGFDTFTYQVADGTNQPVIGTISIDINPKPQTLADLDGMTLAALDAGGSINISDGGALKFEDLTIDGATGLVTIGTTSFTVQGDLTNNSFVLAEAEGGGVDLILVDELLGDGADLTEGTAVAATAINGLQPDAFFTGNGTRDFTVTLNAATSDFENAVGTYVRHSDGSVSDVTVQFADANAAGPGATKTVSNIADDASLEFFFIQDGATDASGLGPNLAIGANGELLEDGVVTGLITYYSEAALNSDSVEHFMSGSVDGGGSMRVGIEDLTGGGDMDYQDVVFTVDWTDDGL